MVKCGGAIPFITVVKSKGYCKGVKSIASELTFTTRGNNFYSLSIPFTFSTVVKGIAFSIFNSTKSRLSTPALPGAGPEYVGGLGQQAGQLQGQEEGPALRPQEPQERLPQAARGGGQEEVGGQGARAGGQGAGPGG